MNYEQLNTIKQQLVDQYCDDIDGLCDFLGITVEDIVEEFTTKVVEAHATEPDGSETDDG